MINAKNLKFNQYHLSAKVWLYSGESAWHFATIPADISKEIDMKFSDQKRGWGSLPIDVTIGSTKWRTSIFPDKKTKGYLLPLKVAIRKKENIQVGDEVNLLIEINP